MQEKKRQLGWKNYRLFVLLIIIVGAIITLFIFSIRFINEGSEQYAVASGSTLLDKDYNLITLESEGQITKNFTGDYILSTTNDEGNTERATLGKNAVAYADADYKFYLYGTSYLINSDTSVKKVEKYEEISKNSPAFYKLGDRKYLLADKNIRAKEIALNTSGYLIVELDRQGDATLVNHQINMKTINPIIIKGTYYDFDVTHEKLLINNEEIDLVSVIGSTNEYQDPETPEPEDEDTPESNDFTQANDTQEATQNPSQTSSTATLLEDTRIDSRTTYYNNYLKQIKTSFNNLYSSTRRTSGTVDNLSKKNNVAIDLTRWTSVTSVVPYPTYAIVNYSVFDPNNEYSQVFINVNEHNAPSTMKRYAIGKENTSYVIRDLEPDKKYDISYGYTLAKVVDENQADVIADNLTIVTPTPKMSIKITKITADKLYYAFYLDRTYIISNATIQLVSNGSILGESDIDASMINNSEYHGSFPYTRLGDTVEVRAVGLSYNGTTINKIVTGTYINK